MVADHLSRLPCTEDIDEQCINISNVFLDNLCLQSTQNLLKTLITPGLLISRTTWPEDSSLPIFPISKRRNCYRMLNTTFGRTLTCISSVLTKWCGVVFRILRDGNSWGITMMDLWVTTLVQVVRLETYWNKGFSGWLFLQMPAILSKPVTNVNGEETSPRQTKMETGLYWWLSIMFSSGQKHMHSHQRMLAWLWSFWRNCFPDLVPP